MTPFDVKEFVKTLPKLSVLLVLLPVAVLMQIFGYEGMELFIVSGVAILGTVTLIGKATEEVAVYAGPVWGGLLNATFGNVTELIIAMIALSKGPDMYPIVLGSVVGSILGNLLLVLGAAMVYGGTKYQTQKFSRTGANVNIGMLWVVLSALVVPSLLAFSHELNPTAMGIDKAASEVMVNKVSMAAAIILLALYALSLVFSLRTHRFLLMPDIEGHHEKAQWSKPVSMGVLLAATIMVAYLSEVFVGSIEHMKDKIGMSEMFIGVIVVAVVGNAAEGMVAVWVARDNKMELSFQIAMGSCLQVALLVAPVLVIASYFMHDQLMPLAFDPFMLMAMAAATVIASAALNDGESNWLEGAMFLAVYIFFAIVFWLHP